MGRRRRGLRKLEPALVTQALDETAASITTIVLTFVSAALFCLLSLLTPDSALLMAGERLNVPFAGPVSFLGFIFVGPAVLIALRVYLQIYAEHWRQLEAIHRRLPSPPRAPALAPLRNPVVCVFTWFVLYLLLPLAMLHFTWKAAVFPAWGAGLLCATVAVVVGHVLLPLRWSWRVKALLSMGAALLAFAATAYSQGPINQGPIRRPFNLFRAELSNQWLPRSGLRGANLREADLAGAYLWDADLAGANLANADLTGADLFGANLAGAYLPDANLAGASLWGADLTGAYLADADLTGAYLVLADLAGASLTDADLTGAFLTQADLTGAYLLDADLPGAYLPDADLPGANLWGADLTDAFLASTDLAGANLADADLAGAFLGNANLAGAKLGGADLTDTFLGGARFAGEEAGPAHSLTQKQIDGAWAWADKPPVGLDRLDPPRLCDLALRSAWADELEELLKYLFLDAAPGDRVREAGMKASPGERSLGPPAGCSGAAGAAPDRAGARRP